MVRVEGSGTAPREEKPEGDGETDMDILGGMFDTKEEQVPKL